MRCVRLVLPNLVSLPQRGDLAERSSMARQYGLDLVEMPADLIKSRREATLTGQPIGAMPSERSVDLLYRHGRGDARYVMLTDPGIPLRDGAMIMPELKWDDDSWIEDYAHFLSAMAGRLGTPPGVVEFHAGMNVAIECMVEAMARVRDLLRCELHAEVTMAVENKPGQAVASVGDAIKAADLMNR